MSTTIHRTAARSVIVLDGGLAAIPVALITPGRNFRGQVQDTDVRDLAQSMATAGQLVPIIVERCGGSRYRIRDGHRRHRAAILAGVDRLLAVIREPATVAGRAVEQLGIHTNAQAFDPLADADAIRYLMFEHQPVMSREAIAAMIGKTPRWVAGRLALLNLTEGEQAAVSAGELPLGEAKHLVQQRRAERDGTCAKPTTRPAPRQRTAAPEHFGAAHPLAAAAAASCCHDDQPHLGGIACGPCWEAAIRADVTAALTLAA